jgi:ribonuclease P protein component
LTKNADFDRVYRKGRSLASRHLVLYAFPRSSGEQVPSTGVAQPEDLRLGVSVGKRVGGAVERNRVKRALREAFWSLQGSLPSTHDYVIVARPGAAELVRSGGIGPFRSELEELAARLLEPSLSQRS